MIERMNMAKKTDVTEETDFFALLEEVERRKPQEIEKIKAQIDDLAGQLAKLGKPGKFVYDDEKPKAAAPKATEGKQTRQRDPDTPCAICGFATVPNHDGRVHRSQGKNKTPFTDEELSLKGMTKKS